MLLQARLVILLVLLTATTVHAQNDAVTLSQKFIRNLHQKKSTTEIEQSLADLNRDFFKKIPLKSQQQIFWLNLYNAFMIKSMRENSNVMQDPEFMEDRRFEVAGTKVSLNDIEFLFLNQGLKPDGRKKLFVRKKFKNWMVDTRDLDILYLLYRGYQEGPPVAHLDANNYIAMIKVMKMKIYREYVEFGRITCVVPSFIREYQAIYFKSEQEMMQIIQSESGCMNKNIKFSETKTPDPDHFFPRFLP